MDQMFITNIVSIMVLYQLTIHIEIFGQMTKDTCARMSYIADN